jgi:hypothetical protein
MGIDVHLFRHRSPDSAREDQESQEKIVGDTPNILMVGPFFPKILRKNGGVMPDLSLEQMVDSYCAWYVARNCMIALKEIPEQVTLEGDLDITVNLKDVMRGAFIAYGIDPDVGDNLNRVMGLMPLVRRQAFNDKLFWDSRFQAFLDSGGHAYRIITRDPDKLNES